MSAPVCVGKRSEIPEGTSREVEVNGRLVAVFHINGQFFAIDGICPHAGGPLAEGCIAGTVVSCPWHGWQFDVTTGRNIRHPSQAQRRYEVELLGDDVLIRQP